MSTARKPFYSRWASRGAHYLHRLVRHIRVAGKQGSFVCSQGMTHQCTIRGIIYDSPFHRDLAYRIDYTRSDTGALIRNAEIPTDIFVPNGAICSGGEASHE